jgi:hypothetical protein
MIDQISSPKDTPDALKNKAQTNNSKIKILKSLLDRPGITTEERSLLEDRIKKFEGPADDEIKIPETRLASIRNRLVTPKIVDLSANRDEFCREIQDPNHVFWKDMDKLLPEDVTVKLLTTFPDGHAHISVLKRNNSEEGMEIRMSYSDDERIIPKQPLYNRGLASGARNEEREKQTYVSKDPTGEIYGEWIFKVGEKVEVQMIGESQKRGNYALHLGLDNVVGVLSGPEHDVSTEKQARYTVTVEGKNPRRILMPEDGYGTVNSRVEDRNNS